MSLRWKSKVMLFALETTYGTDAVPTAADGILATDVVLSPMEGQDLERNLDTADGGPTGSIPVDLHRKITFKVEMAGSGAAGTAPKLGRLLRACACAETISAGVSVAYNKIFGIVESGTLYQYIGGTLYKMVGTRGTVSFELGASGIPYAVFELTSLYTVPVDAALPTPDLTAFQKPLAASNTNTPVFTVGGVSLVLRDFKLDLANKIEPQFLIGEEVVDLDGHENAITARVRATDLATFNPWALAANQGTVVLALEHGTVAGHIFRLDVPKAQVQRPEGLEDGQGRKEWPLRLTPLPSTTDAADQWTLTFT